MSNSQLNEWGLIVVEGPDAETFLHAQLTNDMKSMTDAMVRIAALCTAKGRMLGSFWVGRRGERFMLVCRKFLVPALVKRLSMFVLRSKCKVSDASNSTVLSMLPSDHSAKSFSSVNQGDGSVVFCLATGATGTVRLSIQHLSDHSTALPQGDSTAQPTPADIEFAQLLQSTGLAYVTTQTVEQFVPQSLNFDLVGGVNFNKGCYPGQEVVARTHYLGKVKRRCTRAVANSATVSPGSDIWLVGKDNEPVGMVATSVAQGDQALLMVELPLDVIDDAQSQLFLKSDNGVINLTLQNPPYELHQKGALPEFSV